MQLLVGVHTADVDWLMSIMIINLFFHLSFYYVDLGEAFNENLCERPADVYGFLWCVILLTLFLCFML